MLEPARRVYKLVYLPVYVMGKHAEHEAAASHLRPRTESVKAPKFRVAVSRGSEDYNCALCLRLTHSLWLFFCEHISLGYVIQNMKEEARAWVY